MRRHRGPLDEKQVARVVQGAFKKYSRDLELAWDMWRDLSLRAEAQEMARAECRQTIAGINARVENIEEIFGNIETVLAGTRAAKKVANE